jgi:hypothetical protein
MDIRKQLEYVGDISQLISLRESRLSGGRQEGVRSVEISNGSGLEATILPDRCMDFYQIRFKGHNINYISPCGIAAPQYFNDTGDRFLRNFFVGFLTTCGLQNIGVPNAYQGKEYGLHGRLSNTPAEQFHWSREITDHSLAAVLYGEMKEAVLFGENLSLRRKISFPYGENKILLEDTVTNYSFQKIPFMLLYHFNFGYPMLDEDSVLLLDSLHIQPRNQHAAEHTADWNKIETPQDSFEEMCYYHTLKKDLDGFASYSLYQPKLNIGVTIKFDAQKLDYFCQWKMFGKGEYVMGLEPMNAMLDGHTQETEQNRIKSLEPQQNMKYQFEISFFENDGR